MKNIKILLLLIVTLFIYTSPGWSGEGKSARPATSEQPVDKWLGPDKANHFFTSAVLTGLGFVVLNSVADNSVNSSLVISSTLTFSIGMIKEITDKNSKTGQASFKDLLANALGIGMAILLMKTV